MKSSEIQELPVDMGHDPVRRILIRLSGPAMLSMFFQNLYSLVDTVFVSWVSTTALAALTLAVPVGYIALALSRGVGAGTTALMSHASGSAQGNEVKALARAALPLILLVLAPMLLLAVPGPSMAVFRVLGAHGELETEVYRYALWMALSFPLMGYVTICEAVFMSHGDTRTPMKAMILGNVANIGLDPVFIFGLGLGIKGAAMATFLGWALSAGFMWLQLRQRRMVRPSISFKPGMVSRWRSIGALGAIIALSMLISPVSLGVLNKILAGFGPAAMGAWGVMSRMELMIVLPLFGLSSVLVPFIGFNLGRKDYERIKEGVVVSLKFGMVIMSVALVFLLLFAEKILVLFQLEPHVLALGNFAVRCSAFGLPFCVFEVVLIGVAQGIRHPQFGLLLSGFRMLVTRVPLALLFAAQWGARGVYISHTVSIAAGSVLACILMVRLLGKAQQEIGSVVQNETQEEVGHVS